MLPNIGPKNKVSMSMSLSMPMHVFFKGTTCFRYPLSRNASNRLCVNKCTAQYDVRSPHTTRLPSVWTYLEPTLTPEKKIRVDFENSVRPHLHITCPVMPGLRVDSIAVVILSIVFNVKVPAGIEITAVKHVSFPLESQLEYFVQEASLTFSISVYLKE